MRWIRVGYPSYPQTGVPVRPRWARARAAARYAAAVDTSEVGIQAAKLMDELGEEDMPQDAELVAAGLVVEVAYGDEDEPMRHVLMRCSTTDHVAQVGLFETAKHIALTSGDEED